MIFYRLSISFCMLLAVAFVLLSETFFSTLGGYADQRFLLVIMIGFLIVVSVFIVIARQEIDRANFRNQIWPGLLLSSSFIFLSLPHSGNAYAWVEPTMYALFFLSIFLVGAALTSFGLIIKYAKFLPAVFSVGGLSYGLMTINVYLFTLHEGIVNLTDFLPWGFVNIRYWSHIATWFLPLFPLAVLVGPWKDQRLWKTAIAIGAGLWWWIIFLSTARGSAMGVAFGVVLAVLLLGRQTFPWLKLFLMYLLIGVSFWILLSIVIPSLMMGDIQVRSLKVDSAGRIPLFAEAWSMSLQNFPFGMGPQSWLTHHLLTDAYAGSRKFAHPHNMYLMWAAEYGWVIIFLLSVVVLQAIKYFWKRRRLLIIESRSQEILMLSGFTASVSGALFHSGASAVFIAPGSMLIGLFVLIAFWGLIVPRGGNSRSDESGTGHSLMYKTIGALVSVLITVGWLAWFREVCIYYDGMRLDEASYHQQVGEGIQPRFWFHGNFPRETADQDE